MFPRLFVVVVAALAVAAATGTMASDQPPLQPSPATAQVFVAGLASEGRPLIDSTPTCDTSERPMLARPALSEDVRVAVRVAVERYRARGVDHLGQIRPYEPGGHYFNYGRLLDYSSPLILRDSAGYPMVEVDGRLYYSPVTIAQFALSMHGQYLDGRASLSRFIEAADFLATLQGPDGAFRYEFGYWYYLGEQLEPGWASALAQGQALSVFARAFLLTGAPRFRDAGDAAARFLFTPREQGGPMGTLASIDPRVANHVTFQEYPSTVDAFTLNGFLYAVLGIYDWWQVDPSATAGIHAVAHRYFECSVATLIVTLPLYDLDGISVYDLGYLTSGSAPNIQFEYHALHISLLHAFSSITGMDVVREYEDRWVRDVS